MDWSRFDLKSSLRALRISSEAEARRLLRKLHLRWWHASSAVMTRTLKAAGIPLETLRLIPSICDTCRICREWQKPQVTAIPSAVVPTTFNDQVEGDILFYKTFMVWHMIDRTTRWHAAAEVASKDAATLLLAINITWLTHHGPMREFIVDGESSLGSPEALQFFNQRGIKRIPRPPGAHAHHIERRGDVLRNQLHLIDDQMTADGITGIPFPSVLAEAVFAGNALLSYAGFSPYNAVYGRQPPLLPDMTSPLESE